MITTAAVLAPDPKARLKEKYENLTWERDLFRAAYENSNQQMAKMQSALDARRGALDDCERKRRKAMRRFCIAASLVGIEALVIAGMVMR